jgi:hypothetical protein
MLMTLIHCSPLSTAIIARRLPQTDDAKHQCLMTQGESSSLSQLEQYRTPAMLPKNVHNKC